MAAAVQAKAAGEPRRKTTVINAPSNLGLRPLRAGHVPGAWRGPEVLGSMGLGEAVKADRTIRLERPVYKDEPPPGSRIRNGTALRRFSEKLAEAVGKTIAAGRFPLVVGGDCSILLGCLGGARTAGLVGLVHVDGHSDFFHPGNYDTGSRLGSAAGMDLALATGRGEPLLAEWNEQPLVEDRHVSQIGERDELDSDYAYRDIEATRIRRFPVRSVLEKGVAATVDEALAPVDGQSLPLWLHIDLDVLDGRLMPAVDSPGSPGLTFEGLSELAGRMLASGRCIGADVAIYDPDLDPDRRHARALVACLGRAFAWSSP